MPSFPIYFEKIFDAHAETVSDMQSQRWQLKYGESRNRGICREIEEEQDMKLLFGETGKGPRLGPAFISPTYGGGTGIASF